MVDQTTASQRALSEAMRRTLATREAAAPDSLQGRLLAMAEELATNYGRDDWATLLREAAAHVPAETGRLPEVIRRVAAHYFDKGRCSGHDQFNGRYCRDAAGPERWCIHCAGFMLLSAALASSSLPPVQASPWRAMASAPKDRRIVVMAITGYAYTVKHEDEGWWFAPNVGRTFEMRDLLFWTDPPASEASAPETQP